MIKIFRKIRQHLLAENKFTKYLLYAIGEIVLVVIGILIALQINTWNEERKQLITTNNILSILIEDIKNDTAEINAILDNHAINLELYHDVLLDSLTLKKLQECKDCDYLGLMCNTPIINIEKRGFNLLNNNINTYQSNKDTLITQIVSSYTQSIGGIEKTRKYVDENTLDNINYLRDNYSWFFSSLSEKKEMDEPYNYILTDPIYKNRLMVHYLLVDGNFIPNIKAFKNQSIELLDKINKRLGKS